jgi:hypothetical protein
MRKRLAKNKLKLVQTSNGYEPYFEQPITYTIKNMQSLGYDKSQKQNQEFKLAIDIPAPRNQQEAELLNLIRSVSDGTFGSSVPALSRVLKIGDQSRCREE